MTTSRVILGDCLEVLRTLPDASVDAVVTDPPYGVSFQHGLAVLEGKYTCKWPKILNDDSLDWLVEWAALTFGVLAPNSYAVSFYGWQHVEQFSLAFKRAGFRLVSHLVFPKNGLGLGYHTRGNHEQAFVLAKGRPKRRSTSFSDVIPWKRNQRPVHPTEKPVSVIGPLVRNFSPEGGTVLDPFAGSGTTGVACKIEGRNFIGVELDPTYHAVAERRISETPAEVPA